MKYEMSMLLKNIKRNDQNMDIPSEFRQLISLEEK